MPVQRGRLQHLDNLGSKPCQYVPLSISDTDHDDPRKFPRWISPDICKIEIKRDQGSALTTTYIGDLVIDGSIQMLLANGEGIIAGAPQNVSDLTRQILVDLELHPLAARTGIMSSSRAKSAAYATAAAMSSLARDG